MGTTFEYLLDFWRPPLENLQPGNARPGIEGNTEPGMDTECETEE
jgi:hypothetical protein